MLMCACHCFQGPISSSFDFRPEDRIFSLNIHDMINNGVPVSGSRLILTAITFFSFIGRRHFDSLADRPTLRGVLQLVCVRWL